MNLNLLAKKCNINTCAGAAINPTDIPAKTLPANKRGCDDAKAINTQPNTNGNVAIIKAGRRPNLSIIGPDANEPNGDDKLCTLAVKKLNKNKLKTRSHSLLPINYE